eukprot:gene9636-11813_t
MEVVEQFFSNRVSKDDPEAIFQIVEVVGSGSFGTVCACRWMKKKDRELNGNRLIACKFVEVTAEDTETNVNLVKEIDILKESIDCPFIVEYKGCYLKSSMLLIVMEYCKGGSLLDIIEFTIMEQGQKMKTVIGSPYWMAPEIIMGQGYDQKADIWSLGITAIEIAESVPPRFDIPPSRVIFTIPHQPPPVLKIPSDWSPEFNDFVKQCLSMNPASRPSAKQLLSHPFILKGSSQQILQKLVNECIPLLKEKRNEKLKQMESENPDTAIAAKKAESLKGSVIVLNSNTKTASIMRNKNSISGAQQPSQRPISTSIKKPVGSPGSTGRPSAPPQSTKPSTPLQKRPAGSPSVLDRYPPANSKPSAQPQQPTSPTQNKPSPSKVVSPFLNNDKNNNMNKPLPPSTNPTKPASTVTRGTISIGQQKTNTVINNNRPQSPVQEDEDAITVVYHDDTSNFRPNNNNADDDDDDEDFNQDDYEEVDD